MLTAQFQLPIPEALARLQAHVIATGRPVLDVARDIIARRLRLSPGEADPGPAPRAATD